MIKDKFEEAVDAYMFLNVAYGDLYNAIQVIGNTEETPERNEILNELEETRSKIQLIIVGVMDQIRAAGPQEEE